MSWSFCQTDPGLTVRQSRLGLAEDSRTPELCITEAKDTNKNNAETKKNKTDIRYLTDNTILFNLFKKYLLIQKLEKHLKTFFYFE